MKVLKIFTLVGLPLIAAIFYFMNPGCLNREIFTGFILFIIFERVWESLYLSKDKDKDKVEGDWTLIASILSYIFLILLCLIEFYATARGSNIAITVAAIFSYFAALFLRLWAVKSLGDQWSIHIIGEDKLSNRRLINDGPYRYMRHPVYLGIIIEQISIPLVFNLYWASLVIALVSISLNLKKTNLEECEMEKRFGEDYTKYKTIPRFNIFAMRRRMI